MGVERWLEAIAAQASEYVRLLAPEAAPAFIRPPDPPPPTQPDGSPSEAVRTALERIGARDGEIHAFVMLIPDATTCPGPLHGIPIAVKDLYDVAGLPTTAGSRIRAQHIAAADATVVRQLKAAGALIIGKTATHEFGYGCTTDSPFHGPTRNPADLTRTPGGSSGGSAAAGAAGMVPVALGTDTAGSVRIPAACCGVVGFKPTYGRVSTAGIVPLSWSLDHPGILARTVGDVALVHALLTGDDLPTAAPPGRMRIGVPTAWLRQKPMDPGVLRAFDEAIRGFELVEVELPPLDLFHFVSRIIILAEAGAYHAQYLDRLADYGPDVRSRVELGQHILARDYLLAQRLRAGLCRQMAEVMASVDALATPTLPLAAPKIGERRWEGEPVGDAMTRFAAPFNVTGQPAISLACGLTPDGLPVGLQLVGAVGGDVQLLQIARRIEEPGAKKL